MNYIFAITLEVNSDFHITDCTRHLLYDGSDGNDPYDEVVHQIRECSDEGSYWNLKNITRIDLRGKEAVNFEPVANIGKNNKVIFDMVPGYTIEAEVRC